MEALRRSPKTVLALLCLLALLLIVFAPAIFGGKSLLLSSWDAPSIVSSGALDQSARPQLRLARTPDPGAPAWQTEAWFSLIADQFWGEFNWPLWNPYNAYGTPLAASAQPQPFFPLATLLSLHLTAWTYNLFIVARLFVGAALMFFFARQFLRVSPSLFAAITFSLSGYFIVFLNMPHLSVEVLTPGVMLAFEVLARRRSWTAVAGVAAMIFLGMAAGMPEFLFMVLAFGSLYFLCRVLFAVEFRAHAVSVLVKFAAAVVLGFALSAFLLFPFLEFLRFGHDVHQPSNVGGAKAGLIYDGDVRSALLYLLPLALGPVLNSIFANFSGWTGLKAYWGIVPFFFAIVALWSLSPRWRTKAASSERFLVIFLIATLVLMMLKRFGSVLINWIGHLPLSDMILYPKYQEPLIAFCVAMLAGIGFASLIDRRITQRQILLTAGIVLTAILVLAVLYFPELATPGVKYVNVFFFGSIACGVFVVLAVSLLCWLSSRATTVRQVWLLRGVVVLLAGELSFNFLVPSFYLLNRLPPAAVTPYAGAPYIGFVQARNADRLRVFGRDNVLYPNWSAAFKLADVRNLDALNYVRYRTFIRSFLLPPGSENRANGDLADRFTGGDFPYAFDTDVEKRFLALSSIKYLITDSDYGLSSKVLDDILRQHEGEYIWGFGRDVFRVGDQAKSTLRGMFQHAPSAKVAFKTVVNAQEPVLEGVVAIKPVANEKSDGVGFRLELREGGTIEPLFMTFLDPGSIPADKAGHSVRVDLSRYAGREVELLFSTDPGPKGDNKGDWAGWAGLRFVPHNGEAPPDDFRKIYDEEVRIYEVPSVLPRAALYRTIELLPDDGVLARLKDVAFNPRERVIVSRESLRQRTRWGSRCSRRPEAIPCPLQRSRATNPNTCALSRTPQARPCSSSMTPTIRVGRPM